MLVTQKNTQQSSHSSNIEDNTNKRNDTELKLEKEPSVCMCVREKLKLM